MHSLRLTSTGSTGLGFALGRFRGKRAGGTAPGLAAAANGGKRGVSATSNSAAPVPGDQGVGMDPAKQQQPPPDRTGDQGVGMDSFGEGYSTRSDEEGFGGVYRQNDRPVFNRPGTEVHPNHPEYDKSQGSEVKEKEKSRNAT